MSHKYTTSSVIWKMIVQTEAVVLHSRRYGDTSRIAVLYSKELGKVTVMAKGARTPKSPFGSALEPLSRIKATIYHRHNRDMHTISAAEHLSVHDRFDVSYDSLSAALAVCHLVMRTQADEVPTPEVYALLQESLQYVGSAQPPTCTALVMSAHLRLAEIMGFGLPEVTPLDSVAVKVSIDDGLPRPETAEGFRMSGSAYRCLHTLLTTPMEMVTMELSAEDGLEVQSFVELYFAHHLGRRIVR